MYTLTENEQFAQNAVKNGNYKYEVVENLSGTYTEISNPKVWVSTSTNNIVTLY